MMVWKMIFLFNWVIFRFHVNLSWCIPFYKIVVATNRQGAEAMSISRAKRKEEAQVWEGEPQIQQ